MIKGILLKILFLLFWIAIWFLFEIRDLMFVMLGFLFGLIVTAIIANGLLKKHASGQ